MAQIFKLTILAFIVPCSAFATLPLICDGKVKAKIKPYIDRLEHQSDSNIIERLKAAAKDELVIEGLPTDKYLMANPDLMKLYRAAGLNHPEDMDNDLREDIWVSGRPERCKIIRREIIKIDESMVEDITSPAKKSIKPKSGAGTRGQ